MRNSSMLTFHSSFNSKVKREPQNSVCVRFTNGDLWWAVTSIQTRSWARTPLGLSHLATPDAFAPKRQVTVKTIEIKKGAGSQIYVL